MTSQSVSKTCPSCGRAGPFGSNRSTRDGLTTYCRPCHNERNRRRDNRRYHLRQRYGIEPEEVDRLVAAQDGVCAICRQNSPSHVDHDHTTGRIRGVLCVPCNNGIGLFRDRPELLHRAAEYVTVQDGPTYLPATGNP